MWERWLAKPPFMQPQLYMTLCHLHNLLLVCRIHSFFRNMALIERDATLVATLSNSQRAKGCVPYDPNAIAPTYGYDPTLSAGIDFTVVFFLSCTVHTVQVLRSRKWSFSVFALGAVDMWHIVPTPDQSDSCCRRMHWLGRARMCTSLPIEQNIVLSSNLILIICELDGSKSSFPTANNASSLLLYCRHILHPR